MTSENTDHIYREGCRWFYADQAPGSSRERAEGLFLEVIEQDPSHHRAHNMLGMCYQARGDLESAVRMFRKCTELDPRGVYFLNLGIALVSMERFGEALEAMLTAAQRDPSNAAVHFNIGSLHYRGERIEEAMAAWRKTLELDPSYEDLHFHLAMALCQAGKPEEAASLLSDGIRTFPNKTELYVALAQILEAGGRIEEAVSLWDEFLEANPRKDDGILAEVRAQRERLAAKAAGPAPVTGEPAS